MEYYLRTNVLLPDIPAKNAEKTHLFCYDHSTMTNARLRARVLLLLESSSAFGRGVLRGVARFAKTEGSWQFLGLPRHAVPTPRVGNNVIDGVITQGFNAEAQRWRDVGVPIVNVSNSLTKPDVPCVLSDDVGIGTLVAEDMLARAFKSFAFVGVTSWGFSVDRCKGLRNRLRQAGAEPAMWHYRDDADWTEQQGALSEWLDALPTPTAVLACNDVVAWRTLDAIRRTNRRVPEELAVIGVDDDETLCDLADPPISSVRVASETIGYLAATTLSRLLSGRKPQRETQRVPPLGITTRRSSDVLSIDDPAVAQAMNFIAHHAAESLRVTDVLDAVPVSRRLLERRFLAAMGRTMLEEIHRQRLIRAKNLLAETNLDLDHVARACGFTNAKQMGALFRQQLNTTPKAYRQSLGRVIASTSTA